MDLKQYQELAPHTSAHGLIWLTPNEHCAWRVDSLLTKEPDTIAWLNTMKTGEVLFDVGANMGQYSMWAAHRGVIVHAFEPESQNFSLLCRNIAVNKLGPLITPWPLALCAKAGLDSFHVTSLIAGGSCNSFGEKVDFHLQPKDFAFRQGCYGTTLDTFVEQFIDPDYVKIDVDGFEHLVLLGGRSTLRKAKSVLVEINTKLPEHQDIFAIMDMYGLKPDMATAETARRKEGPFTGIGNVIFYRDVNDFLSAK